MLEKLLKGFSKPDQKLLLDYLEKACEKKGLSIRRRMKYVSVFRLLVGHQLSKISESEIDNIFIGLRHSKYSESTKADYWCVLKSLFSYINPGLNLKDYRLSMKFKTKLPEDILNIDEVQQLIDNSRSIRDKCLVSVIYESGCRAGEIINLRVRDVEFDRYGAMLRVDGKTGQRNVRVVKSTNLLKIYLKEHHFLDDPNAPLFYRMDKKTKSTMTHNGLKQVLLKSAARCRIMKRLYPHLMRHTRATHLAKDLTEQEMKLFFGWTGKSDMPHIYVHLSCRDIDKKILKINGVKMHEEKCLKAFEI